MRDYDDPEYLQFPRTYKPGLTLSDECRLWKTVPWILLGIGIGLLYFAFCLTAG